MTDEYLTVTFTTDATPEAAFAAINNVRGWWSDDLEGESDKVGDVFTYSYVDIHRSTQKVTELVPGRKVVWHVLEGYLNFTADSAEWTGTDVVFDITREGDQTRVRLTHAGLTPQSECFEACSRGWGYYIGQSLPALIATGVGAPNRRDAVSA
jgi:Activator of Hsp90 ATPase homolog 1-like protein